MASYKCVTIISFSVPNPPIRIGTELYQHAGGVHLEDTRHVSTTHPIEQWSKKLSFVVVQGLYGGNETHNLVILGLILGDFSTRICPYTLSEQWRCHGYSWFMSQCWFLLPRLNWQNKTKTSTSPLTSHKNETAAKTVELYSWGEKLPNGKKHPPYW